MPEPWSPRHVERDGEVFVLRGPHLFARYDKDDLGMRNLAVVALSDAGIPVNEVAACFSLSRQYVSMLRGRAKDAGSNGLVRPLGRKKSLSPAKWAKALRLSGRGASDREIAKRFGVHHGTVGRRLAELRASSGETSQSPLPMSEAGEEDAEVDGGAVSGRGVAGEIERNEPAWAKEWPPLRESEPQGHPVGTTPSPLPRIGTGDVASRYAGAMLLHPFLSRLGVDEVLAALPAGPSRRYDATSLVLSTSLGFSLGISSLEGAKHLRVADAGALVGLSSFPHLRTLRPRLKGLAASSDPLSVQRAFAKAMLQADDHAPELYYVDDHFVTYWGARPVAKGYNTRRHLAEPGRDDTFVTDEHWRAICFASGEPRGLSVSMSEVIGQLKEIVGDSPVMVGFDRGGSYPKVFTALSKAGMDWVTWRRAPLLTPSVEPRRSWVSKDGRRHYLSISDELVFLKDYEAGPVRQLAAYEDGKVAFQVLTSNTSFRPAPMVAKLRHRWSIENFNKYIEDHHGAHWLCSYEMDTKPDTRLVANPARRIGRATLKAAKEAVSEAERSLGQTIERPYQSADEHVSLMSTARDEVAYAKDALETAREALKGVPAKVPASSLDPKAKRARPRLAARALQMVCRLLAYNAELDLARRLNAYLDDEDEYRSITRNLLHLGGTITYEGRKITVSLDRPDSPRVAKALGLLLDELASGPEVHLAGDCRPITYQMAGS